jgi:hypothetical protein
VFHEKEKDRAVPRAKLSDLDGYLTTSHVASTFELSPYLIKARIEDGTLPPASRTTDAGVLLFDDDWIAQARGILATVTPRKRRRSASVSSQVPTPRAFLGHDIGEPGWLPDWEQVTGYFTALADASDRVEVEVLGQSTEGKPYLVVAVSAAENLRPEARQRNRDALGRAADRRGAICRRDSRDPAFKRNWRDVDDDAACLRPRHRRGRGFAGRAGKHADPAGSKPQS